MKKLLLFTLIFSMIGFSSCTRDEEGLEVTQEEKKILVKNTIIEFNKSAIETGKLQQFMNSIPQKTNGGQNVESIFQEFLGEQSSAFLSLYYQLEAIGMTGEEFTLIADQFEYLRPTVYLNKSSSDDDECYARLWCAIVDWATGDGEKE